MESDMKHEGMRKHGHHHEPHSYWASWCSPVGLGIFLVGATIAAAIVLHTLAILMFMVTDHHMESRPMQNRMYSGGMQEPMPAQMMPQ